MQSEFQKDVELRERMAAEGVREQDLEETFVASGGHGGQNVNKTATCVMLHHLPTGFRVKCQTTRHQGRNRILARRLLLEKLTSHLRKQSDSARAEQEKLRRQKRPRSRAAKERMLANKAFQATKKKFRRSVGAE